MQFDSMKDATEFIKQYQHIPTVKTYGTTNYMHQFITDRFPEDITFNRDQIHVTTIDIEVQSDEGFPEPDKANYPVISICTKSSKESFYRVWGLGDFTPDENTIYVKCESELQLMDTFLKYWNGHGMPDVVTGWNIKGFDIPYLVNRTRKVLGEESVKKWSIWGLVSSRTSVVKWVMKDIDTYDLAGVAQLDYYDLFRKFTLTLLVNKKVIVLIILLTWYLVNVNSRMRNMVTLHTLYKNDHQKFIEYNIKDVELVDKLEQKLGLITLAMTMAYRGGVNYEDVTWYYCYMGQYHISSS